MYDLKIPDWIERRACTLGCTQHSPQVRRSCVGLQFVAPYIQHGQLGYRTFEYSGGGLHGGRPDLVVLLADASTNDLTFGPAVPGELWIDDDHYVADSNRLRIGVPLRSASDLRQIVTQPTFPELVR